MTDETISNFTYEPDADTINLEEYLTTTQLPPPEFTFNTDDNFIELDPRNSQPQSSTTPLGLGTGPQLDLQAYHQQTSEDHGDAPTLPESLQEENRGPHSALLRPRDQAVLGGVCRTEQP